MYDRNTVQTILQCSECGNKVKIWRKMNKQKSIGHVKHMWCPYCKDYVGFFELKDDNGYEEDGWISLVGKITIGEENNDRY